MSVVIDCGVSAEDLAAETILKLLQSPNGLGWRESKGTLPVFLAAVLRNRFLDHIRRDAKIEHPDADIVERKPNKSQSAATTLEEDLALEQLKGHLLNLIKGRDDERELADFIEAGSMTGSEGKVDQQLADILGVTVGEVINRRKRLWRVAGVGKLREEFRDGRKATKSIR